MKKLYVKFERLTEKQTGPMMGPYKQLLVEKNEIKAFSTSKKAFVIVCKLIENSWFVPEYDETYTSYTIIMG